MFLRGRHWCDEDVIGDILVKHNLDVSPGTWMILTANKSKLVDKMVGIPEDDMRVLRAVDALVVWTKGGEIKIL